MLTAAFPKLERLQCTQFLRAFFRSGWYVALIAALMAVSELFGAELIVYYLYLAIAAVGLLFCEDALCVVPIVCCAYMTFARQNNPVHYPETALFSTPSAQFQLGTIVTFAMPLLIGRLILSLLTEHRRGVPKLTVGFLALVAGFMLCGVGAGGATGTSVFFGFLQAFTLGVFYFYFYFTVDWKKVKKSWLFLLLLIVGAGIAVQIVGMYFAPGVFVEGKVNRYQLYTGWGTYNNVGCMMCMCLPAPFYFALKRRHGWLYSVLGCVYLFAILLTQSRGSILFGGVVFAACALVVLIKAKGAARWGHLAVFGAVAVGVGIATYVLWDKLTVLFNSLFLTLLKGDFNAISSGRIKAWLKCWDAFTSHPIAGLGWTNCPGTNMRSLLPRAHNTVMQLLAAGGVVGFLAYAVHRVNTLFMFFRHPSLEKSFAFLAIAGLLLTSLLDVHVFNFGPGILYGVALVFAECTADPPVKRLRRKNRKNGQRQKAVVDRDSES